MLSDLLMLAVVGVAGYSIFLVVFSEPRKKFLVRSPRCRIPDVDPWDPSIREFVTTKVEPIVCSTRPPLTYTAAAADRRQQLRVSPDAVPLYANSARDFDCCYVVVRRRTDSENEPGACVAFDTEATLPRGVQHVFVECVDRANGSRIYANVHAVVQVTPELKYRTKRTNVVILGIDTMSRLNFRRTMPRTAAFLHATGWLEMTGYNKMADNTLPNLMALLTGLDEKQSHDVGCLLPEARDRGYDRCPFLWRSFKRKGYATAYNEDETGLSTFNYMSVGFRRAPTDFYMRPLMVEAREKLPAKKCGSFTACVGETSVTELLLDNTLDLLRTFDSNLFALTWLNNFSHDNHRMPATLDETMLRFFRALQAVDGFENTVFAFLSDHGFRYGPIRATFVGWLEECLPFLYVHLPPAFRAAHPEAAANLAANGNRLTSPFDVHLTLRDVLEDSVGEATVGTEGCRQCTSLFRPVEVDRSCEEAGIPHHWCTCSEWRAVNESAAVVAGAAAAAIAVTNEVVSRFTDYADGEECAQLSVSKIITARVVVERFDFGYDDYDVVFVAEPGALVLHATVRHRRFDVEPPFRVLGTVSRISSMHGESCPSVTDKLVEYYCQCVFVARTRGDKLPPELLSSDSRSLPGTLHF